MQHALHSCCDARAVVKRSCKGYNLQARESVMLSRKLLHATPGGGRRWISTSPIGRLAGVVGKAAGASLVIFAFDNHSAEASTRGISKMYTKRIQDVLKYLDQHPMKLCSIPMIYSSEVSVPIPEIARDLQPQDVLTSEAAQQSHWSRVVLGLVAVAFGALDDAHNLVTPLCWGSPTEYGGPPIRGSPAAQDASYVHALVHRWEGSHDGEFGTGFSNANYWYRAAGDHPVMQHLQQQAQSLAGGDPDLHKYVAGTKLDPTRLVTLCSEALSGKDPKIVAFADKVVNMEWRLLLDWTLEQAERR